MLPADRPPLGRHAPVGQEATKELDRLAVNPAGLGRVILGLEREEERVEFDAEVGGQ
jgi:hypothetical protein